MRKRMIVIGILIMICSLTGCGLYGTSLSESKVTDAKCKEIIEALEKQDEKALEKLLSKRSIAEAIDLESGMNYIMNNYQGTFKSMKCVSGPDTSEHFDGKKQSKEIEVAYEVVTDKETYFLDFNFWVLNTTEPDMEGIYYLQMMTLEDWKIKSWDNWGVQAGIYFPGWNKENTEDINE